MNSKRGNSSGVVSRLGKRLWKQYQVESEEINRAGTSSVTTEHDSSVCPEPQDTESEKVLSSNSATNVLQDVSCEDIPFDYILEDDEDEFDDVTEYVTVDDDTDTVDKNQAFGEALRKWALSCRVPHATLNKLLHLVREKTDFYLPLDSRTLLKTPVEVGKEIASVAGGQMWYQGIQTTLQRYYRNVTPAVDTLYINLSMDGLPLHSSGRSQFWPIMMQLHNDPKADVLVLGAYSGTSKPDDAEGYLRSLATDLNFVEVQGVVINGKNIDMNLRAIIADSPARAFIKGTAYFNAAHGCTKCTLIGTHDKSARKVTFEGVGANRTDAEFRQGVYANQHQKRPSPLLDVNDLDIIQDIPVGEPLHTIYLGITKKLLKGYTICFLQPLPKWTSYEQEEISHLLCRIEIPSEVHRKLRTLKYLPHWKGSEFSTFLHYASLIILNGRIPEPAFHHFKLFYVAITILSSEVFHQHYSYAGELLKQFVEEFSGVYGAGHITSNVHNLLHIAAEVYRFGPLHTISMFPFENKLKSIKDSIRGGSKFLHQLIGRLTEYGEVNCASVDQNQPCPSIVMKKGQITVKVNSSFMLQEGNRDGWFLTSDGRIVKFSGATNSSNSILIEGYPMLKVLPAFSYPCNSV